MTKYITIFITFALLSLSNPIDIVFGEFNEKIATETSQPEYAKWGQLAMKETKNRYPTASIIDYLHLGRETKNGLTIERFKLWLKQNNKEFGVFITISFDSKTEVVKNISFIETDH